LQKIALRFFAKKKIFNFPAQLLVDSILTQAFLPEPLLTNSDLVSLSLQVPEILSVSGPPDNFGLKAGLVERKHQTARQDVARPGREGRVGRPELDPRDRQGLWGAVRPVLHTALDFAVTGGRLGRQVSAQAGHIDKNVVVGFHHKFRLKNELEFDKEPWKQTRYVHFLCPVSVVTFSVNTSCTSTNFFFSLLIDNSLFSDFFATSYSFNLAFPAY
jgi:hypothetical protein